MNELTSLISSNQYDMPRELRMRLLDASFDDLIEQQNRDRTTGLIILATLLIVFGSILGWSLQYLGAQDFLEMLGSEQSRAIVSLVAAGILVPLFFILWSVRMRIGKTRIRLASFKREIEMFDGE